MRWLLFIICLFSVVPVWSQHANDSLYFFVRYQHTVLFDTDKADIDSIDEVVINIIKRLQKRYKEDQILLEGRADYRGTIPYNDTLAKRRADSVLHYLLADGFEPNHFAEHVFGERQPIADNRTPAGMQANRSVRILIGQYAPAEWIRGQVVDSAGVGVMATIFLGNKFQLREIDTDRSGHFNIPVPKDGIISLEAFSCKHVLRKRYINLAKAGNDLSKLIAENIKIGMSFDFDDILFVGDQDIVLPESIPYLDALVRRVEKASCVDFEVQGHINLPNTPPQDTTTWHYDLSLRRAIRVYSHLVENGIDSTRMTYKGYSNWHMRYPNATTEARQRLNRRVTLMVTGFEVY